MKLLKCSTCNSYGLVEACRCGGRRVSPKPPKYSPEDKWGHYRRAWKKVQDAHQGEVR